MDSYKKLCTQFYDIDKPTAPPDALEFYLQYALKAQGPILEPMCGTGRFLVPMLQRGLDVDGVDGSPQMLAACREKCRSRGLKASLYEQLMHQIDLPRKYKLVFIPSGSFGLLERDHARQSLQRLRALMLPVATLLIEIDRYTPRPSSSWPWGGRWVQRPDGAKIIISWLGYHDAETRVTRSIHKYELVKDGKLLETEFEDFSGPTYEEHEFRDLLTSTGFAAIRTRKLHAMRDADPTDEEVVFECTRS